MMTKVTSGLLGYVLKAASFQFWQIGLLSLYSVIVSLLMCKSVFNYYKIKLSRP